MKKIYLFFCILLATAMFSSIKAQSLIWAESFSYPDFTTSNNTGLVSWSSAHYFDNSAEVYNGVYVYSNRLIFEHTYGYGYDFDMYIDITSLCDVSIQLSYGSENISDLDIAAAFLDLAHPGGTYSLTGRYYVDGGSGVQFLNLGGNGSGTATFSNVNGSILHINVHGVTFYEGDLYWIDNIVVRGTKKGILGCSNDIVASATTDQCSAYVNFDEPINTWCGSTAGLIHYEFSGATVGSSWTSEGTFNVGETNVDCIIDDGIYADTCSFVITVNDDQMPVAECKDITVYLDQTGNQTITNDSIDDGSWDNCGILFSTSQTAFDCSDVGIVPVTLTVTDSGLNIAQCNANITVIDTVKPDAISIAYLDLYLNSDGEASITAFDIDNGSKDSCGIDSMWLSKYDFDCEDVCVNGCSVPPPPLSPVLKSAQADPPLATCQYVTLYVRDVNGNINTAQTEIIVRDTVAPEAICQDISINLSDVANAGAATITPEMIDDGSNDACGIDSLRLDITSFDCGDACTNILGTSLGSCPVVTLTVTDVNCNVSTCTATVTVVDSSAPHAICQDVTVYLDSNGDGEITADSVSSAIPFINNNSWDNCSIDTMWLDRYDFDCSDIYELEDTITVKLTVKDIHENTSTCFAAVTVKDTLAPSVTCQDVTVYLSDELNASATIVADEDDLMNTDPDNNNVLWNFSDNCSDYVSFELSKDTFTCADVCEAPLDDFALPAPPLNCNQVTLTATDEAGNFDECIANVAVLDSFPPHVITRDTTVCLDSTGNYLLTTDILNNGSWDNCEIDSMWLDMTEFSCVDTGVHTVTLTVSDIHGNTASETAQITIKDCMAPVVYCKPLTVYLYEDGRYVLDPHDIQYISEGDEEIGFTWDNCTSYEEMKIEVFPTAFECIHVYEESVPVTIWATDKSGNVGECTTYITVKDTIHPVMKCRDVDIYLDENGFAKIYPSLLNNEEDIIKPDWARTYNFLAGGSYDNCGIDTAWVSQALFYCGDVGSHEVELKMMDPSLNTSTCTSVVTVHDTFPPTVSPVADIEVETEAGTCKTTIDYPTIAYEDNCDATLTLTSGLGEDGEFPVGVTTETWTVTDAEGNTATVSFDVVVTTGNAEPTIDAVADISVEEDTPSITVDLSGISYGNDCEEQDVTVEASGTNEELITSVDLTYTDGDAEGTLVLTIAPDMNGTSVITITVEDSEGAKTVETFNVTVTPVNDAPVLINPIDDQNINASYVLKIPVSSIPGDIFDDIDDEELTLILKTEDGTLPSWASISGDTLICTPSIADTGCVNVIITALDAAGASASDTFAVCVLGYPVNIDDLGNGNFEVQMYPNPTRGKVNLEIESGVYDVELSVINLAGKVVLRQQYTAAEKITFDLSDKVSGVYFIKLDFDGNQVIKKLVLNK